eukprot:TRINITY_DN54674_c0_g1_i1.p1 TRINITY_DN54674_c0_g1~~TRINITY_DN54674_c0_g1_i1.p1  ORF type:complete len:323 (+),score=23.75 TRINITY_DN54674_c0_g1_i1:179-1147(+)
MEEERALLVILPILLPVGLFVVYDWLRADGDTAGRGSPGLSGTAIPPAPAVDHETEDPELGVDPASADALAERPHYWTSTESRQPWDKIDITDAATVTFQRLVDETWKAKATRDRRGKLPTRLVVRKCFRIEAWMLWNRYVAKRRALQTARPSITPISLPDDPSIGFVQTEPIVRSAPHLMGPCWSSVNELYLMHGTSPSAAMRIVRAGFDLSRAGSAAGTMFGPGAYFAECSSKADEYAVEDEFSGMCALIVCRVACGQLKRACRRLSKDFDPSHPEFRDDYDGVLGDREASVGTYREFVVMATEQIYPEFIVLYDRSTSG